MKKISILTPTYNRARYLERLYLGLKKQSFKNFVWIIVNDGSTDETDLIVKRIIENEKCFDIRYYAKENGGKARAINYGLDRTTDTEFVLIVDDHAIFYENGLEIVNEYYEKYNHTDCGFINFLRDDKDGRPLTNFLEEDFFSTVQSLKNRGLHADGCTGFYIDKIGDIRFPEYENEKFVGESVFIIKISEYSKLLWTNKSIMKTEYLTGGLTDQGRKMRLNNPLGMIHHCILMQSQDANYKLKIIYSVMAYAYMYYSNLKPIFVMNRIGYPVNYILNIGKAGGKVLALYWKIKYK